MSGPLDGVLVVDLTRALAGPHAGMMLGDLGARVDEGGDAGRRGRQPRLGPAVRRAPTDGGRESTYFFSANRNKESIALDLKDDGDKAVLTELLRRADVLMENFRPGTLDRLGFGTDVLAELNPRLVTLAISGFGHDGPEGGRAGYDQIAQGEGGLMSLTGPGPEDPQKVGVPISDLLAGMYGAYGVLAALLERERTGRGQVVRTSLLAAVVGVHAYQGTAHTVGGKVPRAQGNHHPSISPYGLFHCAGGGSVQLSCGSEGLWRRLCTEFGLDAEAPGFATNGERVARREEVIELLERTFADIDAAELLDRLSKAGVPAGKVRTLDEVYSWDQVESQGLKISVEHATAGTLTLPGPPLRFFARRPGRRDRDHPARPHRSPGPRCRRRRDPRVVVGHGRRPAASRRPTRPRTGTRHERPGKPTRMDARTLRDLVLDAGSWKTWDAPVPPRDVDDDYAAELAAAAEKTRQDESIITGEGKLRGRRVAVVAGEFGFLAGSIGVAAAERLIAAVERATEEGLPLLAAPVSGGTRMQEGTVAFLQMIGITAAVARHKEAGLPYLVYLRHPTFGGVLASWGSTGHVTIAEPGASIGFLGPRVYEALYGEPFPDGGADRGEPGRPRADRRRRPARGGRRGRRPGAARARGAGHLAPRRRRRRAADRRGRHRRRRPGGRPQRLGRRHRVPPGGPAGRAPAAAHRGDRRRRAVRHRRRREGPRPAAGAGPLRRRALRGARPGPARAEH